MWCRELIRSNHYYSTKIEKACKYNAILETEYLVKKQIGIFDEQMKALNIYKMQFERDLVK